MIYKSLKRIYIGLILLFLYAPIITLIVLSFNASKTRSKWGGFTFDWYVELFQNEEIMSALGNTLIVALLSALIATIFGLIGCVAMQQLGRKGRSLITGITNIPMLNAEIVTGISLMLLFPRMKQLNPSVYEAALDLGATKFTAFRKVVLPDLLPGISSGFLMAFTMSIDDFIITHFTKGPGFDTLSTKIYTELRKGIKPEMYALSTIIFVVVFILLLLVNHTPKEPNKKR